METRREITGWNEAKLVHAQKRKTANGYEGNSKREGMGENNYNKYGNIKRVTMIWRNLVSSDDQHNFDKI